MIKKQTLFLSLSIMLLLAAILIVSFGCGGDSSGVVPEANISQTDQTETLVTKDVEGIIYNISNSSKSTEEEEDTFTVLPISMEGDEGFLAQVNEYIAENSSSKASDDDMQELLTAFNEDAKNYQPLPSWNSAAGLYSSYADSESSTGLSVGADGSFNGSVLTDADEDVVPLDIIVPDGDVFEVETISSDLLNSSESSEINLKGCPAKIITKPNRVIIFEVFSKPGGVNLYDVGLEFNLVDSEIGVICGPIFIRCRGCKSSVAYGLLYVKRNVSTPFDTAIEVTTAGGQSLSIPVQVVKNTAQVTGTVYSDSPILKGWVKSIGPKSFCKIGSDGTYTLPKTYMGTGRKFVAQWWSQEGNRKIKHREVKFVDLMGDCVVDFGVVPTPTPRDPMDDFYNEQVGQVTVQFEKWREELGTEVALDKTISWLNRELLSPPVSDFIKGAIKDDDDSSKFWVGFKDGWTIGIEVVNNSEFKSSEDFLYSEECINKNSNKNISFAPTPIISQEVFTPPSSDVLMLVPIIWAKQSEGRTDLEGKFPYTVYGQIADELDTNGYDVDRVITELSDIKASGFIFPNSPLDPDDDIGPVEWLIINDYSNSVSPYDFDNISNYGVIFIYAHGNMQALDMGPIFLNDGPKLKWMNEHYDKKFNFDTYSSTPKEDREHFWDVTYRKHSWIEGRYTPHLRLGYSFFEGLDFNNSIVYLQACNTFLSSEYPSEIQQAFNKTCHTLITCEKDAVDPWADTISYFFFRYMIYGFDSFPIVEPKAIRLVDITYDEIEVEKFAIPQTAPMTPKRAKEVLESYNIVPDPHDYLKINGEREWQSYQWTINVESKSENIYFPAPTFIVVSEEKE